MEIEQGNEIIAKYMGATYRTDLPYAYTKSGWVNTQISPEVVQSHQFRYHRDYNLLIPIVKKVINELGIEIAKDPHLILGGNDELKIQMRRCIEKLRMGIIMPVAELFNETVNGIQLINKQDGQYNAINLLENDN